MCDSKLNFDDNAEYRQEKVTTTLCRVLSVRYTVQCVTVRKPRVTPTAVDAASIALVAVVQHVPILVLLLLLLLLLQVFKKRDRSQEDPREVCCVCVYVCVYMCVCICVCVYVYMCICVYVC